MEPTSRSNSPATGPRPTPGRKVALKLLRGDILRRGLFLLVWVFLLGCSAQKSGSPAERAESAKSLFEHTTKILHIPSAEANGPEKQKLQDEAASGYRELLKRYPEQEYWAAQALRSLGNIRATQNKLDEAVKNYAAVETHYPQQHWEILMSWKSAADLLWDAGRADQAKPFYQKIVTRYDVPESSQLEKTIVRGSKLRLSGAVGN